MLLALVLETPHNRHWHSKVVQLVLLRPSPLTVGLLLISQHGYRRRRVFPSVQVNIVSALLLSLGIQTSSTGQNLMFLLWLVVLVLASYYWRYTCTVSSTSTTQEMGCFWSLLFCRVPIYWTAVVFVILSFAFFFSVWALVWLLPEVPGRADPQLLWAPLASARRSRGMSMAMAWRHVHVRYCPFCFFISARCTVARFVRSSGEDFSGLTELPATTEEQSRVGSPQGHKAGLWAVR